MAAGGHHTAPLADPPLPPALTQVGARGQVNEVACRLGGGEEVARPAVDVQLVQRLHDAVLDGCGAE